MTGKDNTPLAWFLAVLGVAFVAAAVFYAFGNTDFLASSGGHHYKHAAALIVAAIACFIAANYARPHGAPNA